jgi:hypothetical protein
MWPGKFFGHFGSGMLFHPQGSARVKAMVHKIAYRVPNVGSQINKGIATIFVFHVPGRDFPTQSTDIWDGIFGNGGDFELFLLLIHHLLLLIFVYNFLAALFGDFSPFFHFLGIFFGIER